MNNLSSFRDICGYGIFNNLISLIKCKNLDQIRLWKICVLVDLIYTTGLRTVILIHLRLEKAKLGEMA